MIKKRTLKHKLYEDIKHHILEYGLLTVSAILYLIFLTILKSQPQKQFIATTIFVLYYIVWGIIHHTRDQSLHLKIVLEYIAIGALALIILRSLLM